MRYLRHVRNVLRWLPVVWRDAQYDHGYLWDVMAFKLHLMAEYFDGPNSWAHDGKRIGRQLRIASALCDRLSSEDYDQPTIGPHSKFDICEWEDYCVRRDLHYLLMLFRKYSMTWWD